MLLSRRGTLIGMTPREIAHYRLVSQDIGYPRCKTASEVVASLGAMQAQDYPGALWSIGLRLPKSTAPDMEQAISDRLVIRTWPMRGTLHFVAAADVRWMLELLTPRIVAGSAGRRRQLEIDDVAIERSKGAVIKALQGGKQLTREALYALLATVHISTAAQRGLHILWRLAQDGVICFGPREGKQPTFVLLDEWAPNAINLDRGEALAKLALRYFTGHGPATLQDFVWWSGLKMSDAKAGLDIVASQLEPEKIDDKVYWMPQDMAASDKVSPTAHLLPGFDEYMLGYKDRSAALDPVHAQKMIPGDNGRFMPTILMDGHVVGTWKRTLKRNTIHITAAPFTSLNKVQKRAFAAAAQRYGQFIGMAVSVA
jgi:hypothetical protein